MESVKKGQLIALLCLVIVISLLIFVPSRMVVLRYLAVFALVLSAINILLSRLLPLPGSQLGQRFVLFMSISVACLVVGALLLRKATAVGLSLVCISLLLDWFVIRPLRRKMQKFNGP